MQTLKTYLALYLRRHQ